MLAHSSQDARLLAAASRRILRRSFAAGKSEERVISIDRSGLMTAEEHDHASVAVAASGNPDLLQHLQALIRFRGGPITIAEYMTETLTNPTAGYYSTRDAFGRSGDFITSPDISQLFGEMVGIWCVMMWQQLGKPSKLRLVELGPGRGTLMADLLRSTAVFAEFSSAVSVNLVEVSDRLREQQASALACVSGTGQHNRRSTLGASPQVSWHSSADDIPQDAPALYLAHEFFDALPVHQFQRTEIGWREILVDTASRKAGSSSSDHPFRFVLAPGVTPASHLLLPRRLEALPAAQREGITQVEVGGQAMAAAGSLAQRVATQQGAALLMDYGQDRPYANSLQAIFNHSPAHPLESPGHCDLSCRVDFSALRQGVAESKAEARCWGPEYQSHFLQNMGIAQRLERLLESATDAEEQQALYTGAMRLVGGSQPSDASACTSAAAAGKSVGAKVEVDGDKTDEEGGDGAGQDGLGYQYMAMAITPLHMRTCVPFQPTM